MLDLQTLTLVISHLVLVQTKFPTDPCWLEDEACVIGPENLLSSLPQVPDLATCRQLCQDNNDCRFFSYFGPESFPYQGLCMLLSSCDGHHSYEGCRTEEISCFKSCGVPWEGREAENLLDVIIGVSTELDCKQNCSANPGCNVYTYHNSEDDNFPSFCSLLSELLEPLQSCQHCSTGFPDCRNITGSICGFAIEGEETVLTSYMFNKTGDTNVNILALGDCELTVVAVGGGGSGNYAGGGSGYVTNASLTVLTSELVVRVGGGGDPSSLETSEGQTIITAQPGQDNVNEVGGSGYSGGGGGGSNGSDGGEGGADGGDGDDGDGAGGTGTGLDISAIKLTSFSLTPGRGGKGKAGGGGGGGGGVMVDDIGPQDTVHDGQGYGGGGGFLGTPGPGLVLLEIKSKP